MAFCEEWLYSAGLKYLEVRKLVDENAAKDLPSEPYKSKYEAIKLLKELESDLNTFRSQECSQDPDCQISKVDLIKSLISYELGVLYTETEEQSVGEDHLRKCWEAIRNYTKNETCILLAVCVLNQLGIVWSGRDELQKSCEYLMQAESLYNYAKNCNLSPVDLTDIFSTEGKSTDKVWSDLEKAHTHTLYYLAQVYEHLGKSEAAATYCHATLKRQIESNSYDPIDWAINCATLSQYFVATEDFTVSKHYLACATHILNKYGNKLKDENEKELEENWDSFCRAKANIAKCWVKYGLLLLASSHDGHSAERSHQKSTENKHATVQLQQIFLTEPEVNALEERFNHLFISDYEQARSVFLTTREWLKEAKEYYTLNDHTTDYVQLVRDGSRLYKMLSCFETSEDRQCKMLKRRADMLEETLKALNPQHYLLICRQLTFELAEIYSEMMNLKSKAMQDDKQDTSGHAIKKHNLLACRSIQQYEAFINYLKDTSKKLPKLFSDDVARPALIAFFCLGRLYSKIITAEPEKQLQNLTKSEECYRFVANYVKRNPDHECFIKDELGVITEILQLIPGRMQSVVSSTMY